MKTQVRAIHTCDFCPKRLLTAAAMRRHEHFCKKNPANAHACFTCEHLRVSVGELDGHRITTFLCGVFDRAMYTYQADRLGLVPKLQADGCTRMPLTCPAFAERAYNEIEKEEDPSAPF